MSSFLSLSLSALSFKSFILSSILSLALDSSTLNTLEQSISPSIIITSFSVSSPLKAKKTKKGKKEKRRPRF
jgi:hypothetical protein